MDKKLLEAKENFYKMEDTLCKYASKSSDAIRLREDNEDIRPPYFRDIDRIIHSLSYTRYLDKTQVYPYKENDHISKRMVHVQLVSKIARTIGRSLGLNTDLIEAISLGHDIGHTPLGHAGEAMLNEISRKELGEYFSHNIQSVRHLMYVENNGKGLNLTIQVIDGIMCHNGEMLSEKYEAMEKSVEDVLNQYKLSYTDLKEASKMRPMTLEGCVVRISDVIGYIGRDIEDAIQLGLFKREELPSNIVEVIGNNNKDIINNIVLDIIKNSIDKPYIKMSKDVFKALFDLKKFNYENIYNKSFSKEDFEYYRGGMNNIYHKYLDDLLNETKTTNIWRFIDGQSKEYLNSTSKQRQVIDFIAGMTDDMLKKEIMLANK